MIALLAQTQLFPSQTPYSILDYGVTAIVLVVLGIVLYFVFRSMRQILADHVKAMQALAETMVLMKESVLTLVVDTRHLHTSVSSLERLYEQDRIGRIEQLEKATARHEAEHDHREEATDHVRKTASGSNPA